MKRGTQKNVTWTVGAFAGLSLWATGCGLTSSDDLSADSSSSSGGNSITTGSGGRSAADGGQAGSGPTGGALSGGRASVESAGGDAGSDGAGGDGAGGDGSECADGDCGGSGSFTWPSTETLEKVSGADFRDIFGTDEDVWAFSRPIGAGPEGETEFDCGQPVGFARPQFVRFRGGQSELVTLPYPYELALSHYHEGHIWGTGNGSVFVHFDGESWDDQTEAMRELVPTEDPCKSYGSGIAATGPDNVWTTGREDSGLRGVWVSHFDGEQHSLRGVLWPVVGSAQIPVDNTIAILPTMPDQIFAVNDHDVWFGSLWGVGHFDGTEWSLILDFGYRKSNLLAGLGEDDVWAYGGDPWNRGSLASHALHLTSLIPDQAKEHEFRGEVISIQAGPDSAAYVLVTQGPEKDGQAILKFIDGAWELLVEQGPEGATLVDFLVTPSGHIWGLGHDFVVKL